MLFDKGDGNFSEPIYTSQSDFGATRQLTLTHVILNKIAREAGLKTAETGKVKWAVEASRGGVVRRSQECGEILITRPAEEIPEQLYLLGSATENQGTAPVPFRKESDGIFVIYTKLSSGNIYFTDALEDGVNYTVDSSGRLIEGDEAYNVEAEENVVRLTLNFNAKTISKDIISGVRMIWGATFDVIADMQYVGNGSFKKENVNIKFVDPNDPTTNPPSWLTWVEERYYFISTINGADVCWGRGDNVSAEQPGENEPATFYELHEFAWSQWDHLWKMSHSLNKKTCTVTIETNANNMMIHSFSDVK